MSFIKSGYKLNDNITLGVNVHDPSTGAAASASGSVTFRVYEENGGTPIKTGTLTAQDTGNVTGFYSKTFQILASDGFEQKKDYFARIEAGIGGAIGSTVHKFRIE